MFAIRNLRREKKSGWTYLKVDLDVTETENPFTEDTVWFAIRNKDADMLTDDVYDAFVPFALYLGMFYHQDVHVEGKMSPRLYHNLTHYVMTIFDNFSKHTQRVKLIVDGFREAKKGKKDLIGANFSCGVDSLNTVYSNFIETDDKRFKLNSLFFFNCGQNGYFGEERTKKLWLNRIKMHHEAEKLLGLPTYYIDSNLHAFYSRELPISHIGYVSLLCCALSVQRYVRRYLFANNLSYDEILEGGLDYRDKDLFEYSESYILHLFSTERVEFVIDGCEFTRAEKLERLCDWEVALRGLDVCWNPDENGHNCGVCVKCARTLLVLEAMGKLDNFKDIFDLDAYRKMRQANLCGHVIANNAQANGVIKYLKEHRVFIPPKIYAFPRYLLYRAHRKIKWIRENGTWKPTDKW